MKDTERPRILVLFGGIPLWGQERENIEVIEALVKEAGAECLFVTHREWGHEFVQPELDRRGLPWATAPYAGRFERGMPLRRWIANLAMILHASLVLGRILRRFRPTHIHVCNPAHFINFLPVLLATRVPMIYRLGEEPSLHRRAYAFLWRRLIAARVAEFVCVSRFMEHRLRSELGRPVTTSVIYARPPSRKNNTHSAIPCASDNKIKFVYIGQIAEGKGVHLLVEACIELVGDHELILYIAGGYDDTDRFACELVESVRERRADDRMIFLGEVHDVDRLLGMSDVHVCPSLWREGLGLVVLEAKRSGRPSIVFPSGGLLELVTHGVDGYVCDAGTVDALKDACLSYIRDPERARRQGIEAERSLGRLGIDRFGASWKEAYERNARRGIRDRRR